MPPIIKQAVMFLVVVFLVLSGWRKCSHESSYKQWPTAPARLISAEVMSGSRGSVRQRTTFYYVKTQYEFTVNGMVYGSGAYEIGVPHFSTGEQAQRYLDDINAQAEHRVHYHPITPRKNALAQ